MLVLGWLVLNFLLLLVLIIDEFQWCKFYNNNNSKYNDYNDGDDREILLLNSYIFLFKFIGNFFGLNIVICQ